MNYNPQKIEKKWQKYWEDNNFFKAEDLSEKLKKYILVEFPYPSGEGLHVGHCKSYVALDIISRKKRMEGFNVLFPMGWDAFGLPTENYAIKTGVHPRVATKKNTETFKKQEKSLGLSFDWLREINTTETRYYKWTQWIFLKLYEKGLAYKEKMPINWCPSCKIGLANEEVIEGHCERCGEKVVKKEKEQWLLKITDYADRLIDDLELVDFPEKVKTLQRDWIGKSEGVEFKMPVYKGEEKKKIKENLKVFTTRIDTVFGMSYVVVSVDHPLVKELTTENQKKEIEKYVKEAKQKLEFERVEKGKEKKGVFSGSYAENIFNREKVPIFVADYVLMHYGTGAIMAVPAHDERDWKFAKKYDLPIVEVVKPKIGKNDIKKEAFVEDGILVNSAEFSNLSSEEAREKMTEWLKKENKGKEAVHYKLRDWVFSRQHYWGEPIPVVYCESCGWVSIREGDLPLELPEVEKYQPTETGESPLAAIKSWVRTECPKCGKEARRETDTMPNWAGSNWYYLRYCDPKNNEKLAAPKLLKYWMPVDWYNGGMEHTTLHLLYSRFIFKFLWDIGAVPKEIGPEPYKKRTSHGVILGEGGIKMSKSKGNVVNPDKVVKEHGADTLRLYEMFMGPFDQAIPWDPKGLLGVKRFLGKVWKLIDDFSLSKEEVNKDISLKKLLHKTIKKVTEDIEKMKFNTALSSMMEFSNEWKKEINGLTKEEVENFLKILSPFAPHITEELWQKIGNKKSIFLQEWPKYNIELTKEEEITLIIQVNGKLRDQIKTERGISKKEAEEIAKNQKKIKKRIEGKEIKKVIFVPDKLINFVVK